MIVEASTVSGGKTVIDDRALKDLRSRLHGELNWQGVDGYDEARAVWNALIDRRPALIVRCAGTQDVLAAVDFARRWDLLVAVRGGGHNIAGNGVCDGGLMIDLSRMRAVRVDPQARRARVEGGATWGDFDREAQACGLAAPGGIISTTGVAGLTLGGGFGWLSRQYGLAADNLLSVDLVTAAGEQVTAHRDQNADLFWGVRGGGGNFGIVTSFEFTLHRVGPEVLWGPVVYPLDDAPDVLPHYREFAQHAARECAVFVDLLTAPPLPFLPERAHGTKVIFVIAFYAGDVEEGRRALRPLREFGSPIVDMIAPKPYTTVQSSSDAAYAAGARNYWTSHNFKALSDDAFQTILEHAGRLPTSQSDILIMQLGGAINDVAREATAYPHRDAQFVVSPGARWQDPLQDEACITWIRAYRSAMAPYAGSGTYANFISERQGREREAYGANYERLAALKNKYDPTNFFRLNQNVRPGP